MERCYFNSRKIIMLLINTNPQLIHFLKDPIKEQFLLILVLNLKQTKYSFHLHNLFSQSPANIKQQSKDLIKLQHQHQYKMETLLSQDLNRSTRK